MTARPPKPTPRERLLAVADDAYMSMHEAQRLSAKIRRLLRAHERELAVRAGRAAGGTWAKQSEVYNPDKACAMINAVRAAILGPPRKGGKR